MMDRDSVVARVKKCLALCESANPNEAAAALKKAQALIQKHQVSMVDVMTSDVTEAEGTFCKAKKPAEYLATLAHCVADAFGCKFISRRGCLDDCTSIVFIGMAPQPEVAAYSFDVLRRSLVQGRQDYQSTIPKQTKPHNKARRADTWALGWVYGVSDQVLKMAVPDESREAVDIRLWGYTLGCESASLFAPVHYQARQLKKSLTRIKKKLSTN